VAQGFWRGSLGAQGAEAEGVVALGETTAGFIGHQRAMIKSGWLEGKGAVEQELAGGGFEEVRAAHDLGDAHGVVVNSDGELVGGKVVALPDDEIAEIPAGDELLRAEVPVVEGDGFAVGNAESPTERGRRRVERGIGTAGAGVKWFVITFVRGGQSAGEVFARAGAGINQAGGAELLEGGKVTRAALTLGIGGEGAATVGTFMPLKTKPAEVFEHGGNEFRPGTGGVEVFVAEDKGSGVGDGALLGGPKGAGVAEMQQAGGRGSEASAVRLSGDWLRKVQADYV